MESYIFTTNFDKRKMKPHRGMDCTITVHRIKKNVPEFIGFQHINTASHVGDRYVAHKIIARETNHKMGSSRLVKPIKLTQVQI